MTNKTAMAILEFNKKFKGVELTRFNPHFKNKFASWDGIWQASKALLSELGISTYFTNETVIVGDKIHQLLCLHACVEGGEEVLSNMLMKVPEGKNYAQAVGSEQTYFKRYLFAAMFNVCEMDDDDGNAVDQPPKVMSTEHQQSQIADLKTALDMSNTKFVASLKRDYKVSSSDELDVRQATSLIARLDKMLVKSKEQE